MASHHWVGQNLPDGERITSVKEIIKQISEHRQAKGLAYDSSNPTGHLPRQGRPPKWVPKDITELPHDTNDRTPIRYEPVVMEGIAKDEAKRQATLTTPPNLTRTNTTGDPALDPNHSSTSRIQPQSLGLDPQDVGDDQ
jgi:hypothetical protein